MKLSFQKNPAHKIPADLIAFFIHQDGTAFKKETTLIGKVLNIGSVLKSADFEGKKDQSAMVYVDSHGGPERVLLVGLGEKKDVTLERYRRAAAFAAKRAQKLKARNLALFLPSLQYKPGDSLVAFAEGAFLSLYKFDKYLTKEENETSKVEEIILASDEAKISAASKPALKYAQAVCEATYFARDLANAPGVFIRKQRR